MTCADTRQSEPVPPWAAPLLTRERLERFATLVDAAVAGRPGYGRLDRRCGELAVPDGGVAWFGNVAAECAAAPDPDWERLIGRFVAAVASLDPARLGARLAHWPDARSRLRVRLFATPSAFGAAGLRRPLGRTVDAGLAVDFGHYCCEVSRDHITAWGRSADSAWAVAARNQAGAARVSEQVVSFFGHAIVWLRGGLSTTGHVLRLGAAVPGRIGRRGALVGAPTATDLLVGPIGAGDMARPAAALVAATTQLHAAGPNRVSPTVLWYRGPGDVVAAVERRPSGLDIVAPPPLGERLRHERG